MSNKLTLMGRCPVRLQRRRMRRKECRRRLTGRSRSTGFGPAGSNGTHSVAGPGNASATLSHLGRACPRPSESIPGTKTGAWAKRTSFRKTSRSWTLRCGRGRNPGSAAAFRHAPRGCPGERTQEFSDADRKRPGGLIKNRLVRTAESFKIPRTAHPCSSGGQRTGSSRLTLRGRQKRFAHSPMRSLADRSAGSRNIPARAFRRPGGSGPSATGPRRLFPR